MRIVVAHPDPELRSLIRRRLELGPGAATVFEAHDLRELRRVAGVCRPDVEKRSGARQSLMPDNAVSQLTQDQFVDLLAFLTSKPAQESLRGAVLEYAVAVGYKPELKAAEAPEADVVVLHLGDEDGARVAAVVGAEVIALRRRGTGPGGPVPRVTRLGGGAASSGSGRA